MKSPCNICSNYINNKYFKIQEKMFESGIYYKYFKCSKCNTLQLADKIKNLKDIYPKNYYSFINNANNPIRKYLIFHRDKYLFTNRGILGGLLSILAKGSDLKALSSVTKDPSCKILDVGAGSGSFIKRLRAIGIINSLGIDPYIENNVFDTSGRLIVKKDLLRNVKKYYDVVMFNHSLEHMLDFNDALSHTNRILSKSGICIVRIPVFPSFAWFKYKENWVQIDAPRHINLFSIQAIAELSKKNNFYIQYIYDDSSYFQFLGSETRVNSHKSFVNKIYINLKNIYLNYKASKLNKIGQGDQKVFILRKID